MQVLPFEVAIDYPLYQSSKRLYYIGQTPILDGQSGSALALLYNPTDSKRQIYVNSITITNISDSSLLAEFYLRSQSPPGSISPFVSCTNTDICPPSIPVGQIEYFTSPIPIPNTGISIFSRIVSPQSTLVVDGGQIILGENQSLSVYIGSFSPIEFDHIRFAFGWSEKIPSQCK